MSEFVGRHLTDGEQMQPMDRYEDIGGNAILYEYPNGDYDIVVASDKTFTAPGWELADKRYTDPQKLPAPREKGVKAQGDDMLRSMRRARAKLRRLALANTFDFFVTLTLDEKAVDRYDAKTIMAKVNRWLDNMVRRHGLRYILVPEQHKDGAWHFHGFFAGNGLKIIDSGVRWDGREVYNLPQWSFGFTTAQRLYGEYSAAVAYVCKYIGKQQNQRPMGRWYYSGGALAEPVKKYGLLDYRQTAQEFGDECVEFDIPGSKMIVIHHREERHEGKQQGRSI